MASSTDTRRGVNSGVDTVNLHRSTVEAQVVWYSGHVLHPSYMLKASVHS